MSTEPTEPTGAPEPTGSTAPGEPDVPPPGPRKLGGLLKHSAIYSAAPLLRQLISIGMQRLYTGWLKAARFGLKEVVDLWTIAFQQLLGFNLLSAMMRFYFDHEDENERAKVISSCTLLTALMAWTVCGTALVFSDSLAPLLLGQVPAFSALEREQVLQLALLLIPFQLTTFAGYYYLMALKRSTLFTSIQTGKLLFEVAMNFWLIGYLGLGVQGFLMSMLAGEAITSLGLCSWMMITLKPRIDPRVLKPILAYALPLIPVGVCQLVMHSLDRRLVTEFAGAAETGIYGLGYKISYLVTAMVLSPFVQIFQPWIFGVEDPEERSRLVARVSTYGVLVIGGVTLAVILGGRQAAILLSGDEAFWAAYHVIPFVAGGYVFWGLYHVSQIPLLIAKRTGPLLVINVVAAAANVGLNFALIPRFGMMGAAIATCTTFAFLALLGMLASRSEAHVPFEAGRLLRTVLCVALAGALALWIDTHEDAGQLGMPTAIAVKVAGLLALLGYLWLGVLRADERHEFVAWVRARLPWARA